MAVPVQNRPATAAHWARALDRALEEALDVLVEPLSGQAFVESATTPGTLYIVTADSCSCPAGARGQACKHRACYLAQIGEFPVTIETPAPHACVWCVGSGRIPNDQHERYDRCDHCNGSGIRPNHHLHDAPPAPMVATAA
jgi:hypothetical protein